MAVPFTAMPPLMMSVPSWRCRSTRTVVHSFGCRYSLLVSTAGPGGRTRTSTLCAILHTTYECIVPNTTYNARVHCAKKNYIPRTSTLCALQLRTPIVLILTIKEHIVYLYSQYGHTSIQFVLAPTSLHSSTSPNHFKTTREWKKKGVQHNRNTTPVFQLLRRVPYLSHCQTAAPRDRSSKTAR